MNPPASPRPLDRLLLSSLALLALVTAASMLGLFASPTKASSIAPPSPSGLSSWGGFFSDSKNASLYPTAAWEGQGIIESSALYDASSGQCDLWYRAGPRGNESIGYAQARDAGCRSWEKWPAPVLSEPGGVLFPFVFEKDGAYYMLAVRGSDQALHLYRSPDKINWAAASSAPVLLPSKTGWDARIDNPAILFTSPGQGWLFYEGTDSPSDQFQVGAIAFNWTGGQLALGPRPARPSLASNRSFWRYAGVGNPDALAVPGRGAVMLLAGGLPASWNSYPSPHLIGATRWVIGCAWTNQSADLANPASWHDCPHFLLHAPGEDLSDPSLIQTHFGKESNLILTYTDRQSSISQIPSNFTVEQFYDDMVRPDPDAIAALHAD